MSVKRDYYEVLGLSKGADAGSIKKAYRKLAKKYHPDTNQGDKQAEKKFKEVTEAYTVLSDPEKKKMYDQFGHAAFDGSMPEGGAYQYSGAGAGQNGGTGISTCYPSTTSFDLALGPDLPRADQLYSGNLRYSA